MDAETAARAAAAGCPVAHDTGGAATAMKAAASSATSSNSKAASSGCPVDHGQHGRPATGPANSEMQYKQTPAQGQRAQLPTERAISSIPSAEGSDPLWVYPSQQQFYNAMKRKGYSPQEEEMSAVVAIHNAVNERAWAEVVAWEATLHPECTAGLKLIRFEGKPTEPTPKARVNSLLGYIAPFDRHDWTVSRCGKEVTYLLDFYNGRSTSGRPVAMHIDARPAGDDVQGAWDRVRMPFVRMWQSVRGPALSPP